MVVHTDIVADARVRKSAQTVHKLGYDVTLIHGLPRGATERVEGCLDGIPTIGLPVPFPTTALKAERERARRARRRGFPGYRSKAEAEWVRQQNVIAGLRASRHSRPVRAILRLYRFLTALRLHYHDGREARLERRWAAIDDKDRPVRRLDWNYEVPAFSDISIALTREIWRHDPTIIHAHDAAVLEAAVNATNHLRAQGGRRRLIYDAHEFVAGAVRPNERLRRAWQQMESHYIKSVDAVITVSEPIAEALHRNYHLAVRPTVVLNAPVVTNRVEATSDVRRDCQLGPETPLIVYSGVTAPKRGVATVVDALAQLPGVHLALICVPSPTAPFAPELARRGAEMGVADRMHLLEPVEPEAVLDYLRTADLGVHPMIGGIRNHEMALPNKLFDYVFAGLPIVTSDLAEMGDFVRRTGVGEVFPHGDVDACAKALAMALTALPQYRARIAQGNLQETYSWESQEAKLASLYRVLSEG